MIVVNFPNKMVEFGFINDIRVPVPKTRNSFLTLCKQFLPVNDYKRILCAIMDTDYYNESEHRIQRVVDSYFSFKE
jgi:hypothetical protein